MVGWGVMAFEELLISAHVRLGERRAPERSGLSGSELGARAVESHISRKTSEMPRISCTLL